MSPATDHAIATTNPANDADLYVPTFDEIADELPEEANNACIEAMDALDLVIDIGRLAQARKDYGRSCGVDRYVAACKVCAVAGTLRKSFDRIEKHVIESLAPKWRERRNQD